ncbi:MAG: MgtC/SapB family protein [Solirubrobacterales bacterium]|nr:MgtC/SapB family protein [Solirubrobacterales bacterium]
MHELDLVWRLAVALGLSSLIGLEREVRQKSAGLRTYALVGTGAALFMLVSQYGFATANGKSVILDPSRVAAQIVSGIGFIGGGLIFVHRSDVRGLTTAAGVWVVAAIGMAVAGDEVLLALAATGLYLIVSFGYPLLTEHLPRSRGGPYVMDLTYLNGKGVLRDLVGVCSAQGFAVSDISVRHDDGDQVTVRLELRGRGSVSELAGALDAADGVTNVHLGAKDIPAEVSGLG